MRSNAFFDGGDRIHRHNRAWGERPFDPEDEGPGPHGCRHGGGAGGFGHGGRGFGPGGPGEPGDFGPGGRGFGPGGPRFGRGPGFGGFGGPGPRGRGRRRRGDVRLALLMLLREEAPLNGYQLMQGLEQRTQGLWRPSPGSVYPALQQLEDEGLIRSAAQEGDSGRAFELTDAGRKHLEELGDVPAPWELPEGDATNPRIAIRNGMVAVGRAMWNVAQDGTPEQIEQAVKILEEARMKIYRILAGER